MSTANPDERERRVALAVRPWALGAAILIQFLAPALWLLDAVAVLVADPGFIILYVLPWCVVGIAALMVPSSRSTYLVAAFILAYIGGLFLVMQISGTGDQLGLFGVFAIAATYAVAAVLVVLYFVRQSAMRRTAEIGVDAVATVVSAPVSGRVNYVTRQRLTLKFTDQQGAERFLRVGKTGGGWSAGDTIPIRYDPTRPGYRRGIIVDGSGPTLFG